MILATVQVEDVERFWATFFDEGAELRRKRGTASGLQGRSVIRETPMQKLAIKAGVITDQTAVDQE